MPESLGGVGDSDGRAILAARAEGVPVTSGGGGLPYVNEGQVARW